MEKILGNSKYFEEIKCNLCGSENYKVKIKPDIENYDPKDVFSASGGIMGTQQVVRCKDCGLLYVNPRIKEDIIINSYSDAEDELYVSQEENRIKTFSKSLKLVEKYSKNKGKILDVGAAAGFFLQCAKGSGWKTYGVEPSKWMTDWGNKKYNVNIKNGVLIGSNFESGFFDAVTMWDVLEHTLDPKKELIEVNRILKKDGILIINYPNIGSTLAKIFGEKWWFLLSVHLYYFSNKTIKKYLNKTGFEVIRIKRYVQRLNLEHLMKMFGLYSKPISNLGLKIIRALRMTNWSIPYYASQANVIARKIDEYKDEK